MLWLGLINILGGLYFDSPTSHNASTVYTIKLMIWWAHSPFCLWSLENQWSNNVTSLTEVVNNNNNNIGFSLFNKPKYYTLSLVQWYSPLEPLLEYLILYVFNFTDCNWLSTCSLWLSVGLTFSVFFFQKITFSACLSHWFFDWWLLRSS